MRDLVLVAFLVIVVGAAASYPFVGALGWAWISIQTPHQEAFGFSRFLPSNLVIAIVTIAAWLLSRQERKMPPMDFAMVTVIIFLLWVTFNSFFAFDPSFSWPHWNIVWKTYALGFVAAAMLTSKVRFQALVWVVCLSIGYYGVKGGLFTLLTGGHSRVLGPPNSILGDNNQLALAIVMTLPLLNYLRGHSMARYVRLGLLSAIVIETVSVLGSYSRGGFISLGTLVVCYWLRAKRKLIYPIVAVVILVPAFKFMPQTYFNRLNTIGQYETDDSFQGRVSAWEVAYRYAVDHFPFGAGFYGPQQPSLYRIYVQTGGIHAAHSIYFQVLGENGFIGLFIYVLCLTGTFINLSIVTHRSRRNPELAWAYDLARMIQLSLVVFCVGGAALSMAYFDVFVLWISLSIALRAHVTEAAAKRATEAQGQRLAVPLPLEHNA